jgi:hypothetical protein
VEEDARHAVLLAALSRDREKLRALLAVVSGAQGYEDPIYRFYHHSFKVFGLQNLTVSIVTALRALMPDRSLNSWFEEVVAEGTGKTFELSMNPDWTRHTRPILEAFFHARFFLEMTVRYESLVEAPVVLPSGWAALLTLYGLR